MEGCFIPRSERAKEMNSKKCVSSAVYLDIAKSGSIDLAIQQCEEALKSNAFYAPALWSRSFLKMLQGDLSYWAKYEWYDDPRYGPQKGWFRRRINKPLWMGEQLKGKKIFLYCDEGFGDFFQFIRYAKLIKERGGHTIVECLPNTTELIRACPGVDETVEYGEVVDFDLHCPLMLAPRYFDVANFIPAEVYLKPSEPQNEHLKCFSFVNKPSIGIVWKGNPKHSNDTERSISPYIFKKLKTNHLLVSLQHGEYGDDFLNMGIMIKDWADTAYIISKMDLIITVDTAVAHLAGAMGKEVWVLLPKFPDWRWGLNKPYTSWYPSMRLFRREGSWEELIVKVNENLCGR